MQKSYECHLIEKPSLVLSPRAEINHDGSFWKVFVNAIMQNSEKCCFFLGGCYQEQLCVLPKDYYFHCF